MLKRLASLLSLFVLALPLCAQTLYLSENNLVGAPNQIPVNSNKSVDAWVTGVADKGVVWTSSGGTLTNATCTANGLCTVSINSATTTGAISLTATSHANGAVSKTTYLQFVAAGSPTGTAPDFLITSTNLTAMQAKAVGTNPNWTPQLSYATTLYNNSLTNNPNAGYYQWQYRCNGGNGNPAIPMNLETAAQAAYFAWMALMGDTSQSWACFARDQFLYNMAGLENGNITNAGNSWSDDSIYWAYGLAWAIKSGALTSSDMPAVRQFLAWSGVTISGTYPTANVGPTTGFNTSAQIVQTGNQFALTSQRGMGNNYAMSSILWNVLISLMTNDNSTDDPLIATNGIVATTVATAGTGWNNGDQFHIGSCGATGQWVDVAHGVISVVSPGSGCAVASGVSTTAINPAVGSGLTLNITRLSNTCGAARGALCSDYTAGSLHSYFSLADQSLLRMYIHLEDPAVSYPVLNAVYPSGGWTAPVNIKWAFPNGSGQTFDGFGDGWGGESAEGSWYYYSLYRLKAALNIIHTAGYENPTTYGPQIALGNDAVWDLVNWGARLFITGSYTQGSYIGPSFGYVMTGDANAVARTPVDFLTQTETLTSNTWTGRQDTTGAMRWFTMASAFGGIDGSLYGCSSTCGYLNGLMSDYARQTGIDMFISQPPTDPTVSPPSDPGSSYPTDWWNGSFNRHQEVRSGFTNADSIVSIYGSNTLINHEWQRNGSFDIWYNGGVITKGRSIFTFTSYNYTGIMATSGQNLVQIYDAAGIAEGNLSTCFAQYTGPWGGQLWQEYQRGIAPMPLHSEMPNYSFYETDQTLDYTGCYNGTDPWQFVATTSATRSILNLRGSNELLYYDRAATVSTSDSKSLWTNTSGNGTVSANTVSWTSVIGGNKAKFTSLLPAGATVAAAKVVDYVTATAPFSSLQNGTTMQATCTATNADGTTTNITSTSANWISSDPTKFTVSSTGLVTAVGLGSALLECGQGVGGLQPVAGLSAPMLSLGTVNVISGSSTGSFTGSAVTGQASDVEVVGNISVTPSGTPLATNFLSAITWTNSAGTPATATLVQSTAGQGFDGGLIGTTLGMFKQTLGAFTGVTYPASGATTHYVADLSPNTLYNISGAGTPASATTDKAGVLTFSATGTGPISISPSSGVDPPSLLQSVFVQCPGCTFIP